jgi:hypothetical protein
MSTQTSWGLSSSGRARVWQTRGGGFESRRLHHHQVFLLRGRRVVGRPLLGVGTSSEASAGSTTGMWLDWEGAWFATRFMQVQFLSSPPTSTQDDWSGKQALGPVACWAYGWYNFGVAYPPDSPLIQRRQRRGTKLMTQGGLEWLQQKAHNLPRRRFESCSCYHLDGLRCGGGDGNPGPPEQRASLDPARRLRTGAAHGASPSQQRPSTWRATEEPQRAGVEPATTRGQGEERVYGTFRWAAGTCRPQHLRSPEGPRLYSTN